MENKKTNELLNSSLFDKYRNRCHKFCAKVIITSSGGLCDQLSWLKYILLVKYRRNYISTHSSTEQGIMKVCFRIVFCQLKKIWNICTVCDFTVIRINTRTSEQPIEIKPRVEIISNFGLWPKDGAARAPLVAVSLYGPFTVCTISR